TEVRLKNLAVWQSKLLSGFNQTLPTRSFEDRQIVALASHRNVSGSGCHFCCCGLASWRFAAVAGDVVLALSFIAMDLIHLIWPAALALLLVILVQTASRSRTLVIVLVVAVAIWLTALVVMFWV